MFSDNEDKMVALLEQIASNTGDLDELEQSREVTIETESVASRVGVVEPQDYIVVESDNLDHANDDGTVSLSPGDQVVIAEWQPEFPFALLAAGATDAADVEYTLIADTDQTLGGVTSSPLGTLNDPFSFVDAIGGAPSCEKSIKYVARLDSDASSSVDIAARLHAEVMS